MTVLPGTRLYIRLYLELSNVNSDNSAVNLGSVSLDGFISLTSREY